MLYSKMPSKEFYVKFSSIIIYFLPLTILSGPFLADLSISLLGILFVTYIILHKDYKYINNIFTGIFSLLCLYLIFNSLISETKWHSLSTSIVYFRFGLFSLAIWFVLENNKKFKLTFFKYLVLTFLIALSYGYLQFFIEDIGIKVTIHNTRLALPFTDNAVLGQYLSRLFPLLIAFFIFVNNYNFKNYFIIFIIFTLTDVLIYLSGERTALGLIFLSSCLILILVSKLKYFRIISILFSILFIFLISIYFPAAKERNVDYTLKQIGITGESKNLNIFSPDHEKIIITSFNMFIKNPLFGIGVNNFRNQCGYEKYSFDNNSCQLHPHNNLIQLMGETGIVGLIFFIAALTYFVNKLLRHFVSYFRNHQRLLSDYQICLIICFFCSFWPFFPSLNLFNNWINVIYYLPLGFYLYETYNINENINYNS